MTEELIRVADFTAAAQMPNGKQFAINGCIFQGETEEQVNARVDLYFRIIDRQRTIAEIPELELKHEQLKKNTENTRKTLMDLDEQTKNGSLASNQKTHYQNLMRTLQEQVEQLEKGAKAIQEAKDKIK